jgi:Fe-S cluster assembly ATPase SufC
MLLEIVKDSGSPFIRRLSTERSMHQSSLGVLWDSHARESERFSGGEKKLCRLLQMTMIELKYAILDEMDSRLDMSTLTSVSNGVNIMPPDKPAFNVLNSAQKKPTMT